MKKLIAVLTVLLLLAGMSISAYAQGEPQDGPEAVNTSTPIENIDTDLENELHEAEQSGKNQQLLTDDEVVAIDEQRLAEDNRAAYEQRLAENNRAAYEQRLAEDNRAAYEQRLADGTVGRGTVENPYEYWETNGYPDNISFAYDPYSEKLLDDGISVAHFEIGIINADEASKQEIIDLLSPSCFITFRDCLWSYNQRKAAFDEIYASRNDIVRDVVMGTNSEVVVVEIADGYEKEYARKYVEQYGAFVTVTNEIPTAADGAMMAGGLEKGGNSFGVWVLPMCLIVLFGIATVLYFNRTRLIPAMQTANGNVVTGNAPVSTKQTIAAIKNSALTPSDDVFKAIMDKVNNEKK